MSETELYRFDCPLCSTTWNGDDLGRIAKRVAWHWNKEHNGELSHSHRQIDTVERGGHNVHKNEWTVQRIPIYVTSFDVMERLGREDGMAVPPENGNICDECYRFLRQHHEHVVIEESVLGNDTWRCRECHERLEIGRKQEENQQIVQFLADGGRTEQTVVGEQGGDEA